MDECAEALGVSPPDCHARLEHGEGVVVSPVGLRLRDCSDALRSSLGFMRTPLSFIVDSPPAYPKAAPTDTVRRQLMTASMKSSTLIACFVRF